MVTFIIIIYFDIRLLCPIRWCWQHQATPKTALRLSCCSTAGRPHSLASFFRHSDHVFLGLPCPLVPGIVKSVTDLIKEVARCIWSEHLSHRSRRTAVIAQCQVTWVVKPRMFRVGFWCHRSSDSWRGHCGGAAADQKRSVPTFPWRRKKPNGHRPRFYLAAQLR